MLKTRVDFVCNAGDADADAMAGVIHCSMGMACGQCGMCADLFSWYPLEMHYVSTQPAVYFL